MNLFFSMFILFCFLAMSYGLCVLILPPLSLYTNSNRANILDAHILIYFFMVLNH